MKKYIIYIFTALLLTIMASCNSTKEKKLENKRFNISSVKNIIKANGKQWDIGIKKKDINIISNIYDKDAHYLPDADKAFHGNQSITEYWKSSLDFLTALQLNMETLEGTKDLLYETGNGTAVFLNQTGGTDTLKFKYVNVWKLQPDGSYKVVIDTFNRLSYE